MTRNLGGGVSIIGDIFGMFTAPMAAAAQERQAREAMELQRQMYEQTRADQAPWLQAGQSSLADLMRGMQSGSFDQRFDPSQVAGDPGFQFRMAEGQKALERSAAARGGLMGGGFAKSLARYGQGLASDEYGRAWERNQAESAGRFNRLANLAGIGQQSAQSLGNFGSNYANSMGQLYGAIGNAQSAGMMGPVNSLNNAAGTLESFGTSMVGGIPTQTPSQAHVAGNYGKYF